MPTYEYRCRNGHGFEEFFLKMSDAKSALPCPTCGEIGERQMSAGGGLLFKGSGFYITDYGKDGKKSQAPAKSGAGKSEGSGSHASDGGASSPSESPKSDGGKSDAATPAPAKSDGASGSSGSTTKSGGE